MRKLIIFAALCLLAVPANAQFQSRGPRTAVLVDNDLCGDFDGLYHLAHQLLCTSSDVRGIVGANLGSQRAWAQSDGQRNNAEISVQKALEVVELCGKTGKVTVKPGAPLPMTDDSTPAVSEGAQLIVDEAKKATPEKPLYLLFGGPLTDVASAWLMDPGISKNVILVWIGGQEYDFGNPLPAQYQTGSNEVEYNLRLDINAAKVVFNKSDLTIWQIPRDVYRQCLYGVSEIEDKIAPLGELGKYLYESMGFLGKMSDAYVLGDSPLCLVSTLTTTFEAGPASSFYVTVPAPRITDDGHYDFSVKGREINVFKTVDTRLMFGDMESRFRLLAKNAD